VTQNLDVEIVERKVLHDRWSIISDFTIRMPNGAIEKRIVEDHGGAAAVLLYDPERRVALLVRQPRVPVFLAGEAPLLEVVAGSLDDKDDEVTARKEAWEEAGVTIDVLEKVGSLWMMPAVSMERLSLFLAPYSAADRTGAGGGAEDENECISVEEVSLRQLADLMHAGLLTDGKTFILVQALMLRQPGLFA
jgi:nudix-type nucleoside diphosphatase (YffH/AdpP family)